MLVEIKHKFHSFSVVTSIQWNMTQQLKKKKNQILIHATTQTDLKDIMLCKKKSVSKDYILHNSIYITLLKWQNNRDVEQIEGSQGQK